MSFRQDLLTEWTRGGPIYNRSTVLGYSDESFTICDLMGTEVLSEVHEQCELPDSFLQSEVKFSRVRKQFLDPNYRHRKKWEAQFQLVRIYIIDPKRLTGLSSISNRLQESYISKSLIELDPAGWHHFYPLEIDGIHYGLYDFEGWYKFQDKVYKQALNKKGSSLANVRRQVLKSQALHADIMHLQPVRIENGDYEFNPMKHQPDARSLALAQTSQLMFDEGHSGDMKPLESRLNSFRDRFKMAEWLYKLPPRKASVLTEGNSKGNDLIQLADFCAGYAKSLYENLSDRDELPKLFKAVYVNGIRM